MTKNQIEYQKLQLDREYKNRSLEIESGKLAETSRANRAQEALTERRDSGTLGLRAQELAETGRHNQVVELETERSHKADETERNRHNLATESTERTKASAAVSQAAAAHAQVQLGYASLAETSRHNQVLEVETNRHNTATETIQKADTGVKFLNQQETARHNQAMEKLQEFQNDLAEKQFNVNKWRARFQNAKDLVGVIDVVIDDLDQATRTWLQAQLLKEYGNDPSMTAYLFNLLKGR